MPEDVFRWVVAAAAVLAAVAIGVQAFILASIYEAGRKAHQSGKDAQSKLTPLVERVEAILTSTGKILEETRPRISDISAEAVAIVKTTRQQTERISELINDVNERARTRIAQIDHTVDHTVAQVEYAGDAVKSAVLRPVKEVNGIVAGVKAAVASYAQGRRPSVEHATQDEEMFI
jgi:uncharacterized protein YoxC